LPLQVIKDQMTSIYFNYRKIYGNNYDSDAFNHIDLSTDSREYETEGKLSSVFKSKNSQNKLMVLCLFFA